MIKDLKTNQPIEDRLEIESRMRWKKTGRGTDKATDVKAQLGKVEDR